MQRQPMLNEATSPELLSLLNHAIARELQVSVQYMLQHAIGAGQAAASGETPSPEQSKFVASHAQFWLPGATLKKIAITEMRHAEAIVERVVLLRGEPTTQPGGVRIGESVRQMLENDREEERAAIELYKQIIAVAGRERDEVTRNLFQRILADEEKHHRVFSNLLGKD